MDHVADFKRITGNILAEIEALKANLQAIMVDDNFTDILAALNELDERRVTLLEPMMLQTNLKQALDLAADIQLIDYVNRRDPARLARTAAGASWFFPTKESGRVTVEAVKAIRECLDHRYLTIGEGKRVCELIIEGKIK